MNFEKFLYYEKLMRFKMNIDQSEIEETFDISFVFNFMKVNLIFIS